MAKANTKTSDTTMSLSDIRSIGGILTGQAVEREVTWTQVNDDGTTEEHKFKVGVVKLGVAASERVWAVKDEESRWATTIHEAIRLGEDFKERIPYEDACNLDQGLFAALTAAANAVNPKPKEKAKSKEVDAKGGKD